LIGRKAPPFTPFFRPSTLVGRPPVASRLQIRTRAPITAGVLIGLVFLLCLASVPLAGGRLGVLADLRFRASWLLVVAIAVQVLIVSIIPGDGSPAVHNAVHIATYLLVGAFVVANRRVPWVWLIALGGALNFAAITANGGVMPADPDAVVAAGLVVEPGEFVNSGAVADPHLAFLGDVFWVPSSWPVSNVFSVGDVLILLGALLALHCICASRIALRRFAVPAV
jgi:Family of unknown function (DUF5317)